MSGEGANIQSYTCADLYPRMRHLYASLLQSSVVLYGQFVQRIDIAGC